MTNGPPLAISPYVSGEPVSLGAEAASADQILSCLGMPPVERAGCLLVAPTIALIHSLTVGTGAPTPGG